MPATSTNETTGLAWLVTRWSRELASVIGQTGRSLPLTEIAESGEAPRSAGALWRAQRLSLLEGPCIWIGTGESAWKEIGEAAGAAKESDGPEIGSAGDVYREILTQSFSGLATVLTKHLGDEITCPPGEEIPAPPEGGERCFVDVRIGDGEPVRICFIAGNRLLQMLGHAQSQAGAKNDIADNIGDGEPGVAAFTSVLDVELPVSVSLGTTRLGLEEVLKLGEGSVIPLGREVSELVIVRVNGRVVARGEIVVVRGNYAVRIQELSSLSERLQELNSIRWPQSADAAAS